MTCDHVDSCLHCEWVSWVILHENSSTVVHATITYHYYTHCINTLDVDFECWQTDSVLSQTLFYNHGKTDEMMLSKNGPIRSARVDGFHSLCFVRRCTSSGKMASKTVFVTCWCVASDPRKFWWWEWLAAVNKTKPEDSYYLASQKLFFLLSHHNCTAADKVFSLSPLVCIISWIETFAIEAIAWHQRNLEP
jgi:hypothetical protein